MGRQRAALVVGLALHFALSASPCGLRRATLRAQPTGQKNRDPVDREEDRRSWGLLSEKFFKSNSRKKQKRYKTKKGDILIEVRKGTF